MIKIVLKQWWWWVDGASQESCGYLINNTYTKQMQVGCQKLECVYMHKATSQ